MLNESALLFFKQVKFNKIVNEILDRESSLLITSSFFQFNTRGENRDRLRAKRIIIQTFI